MRINLVHNPTAGGALEAEELVALVRAGGHQVAYCSSKDKNWDKALAGPADLIAVASGDGTLAKVARRLVDSGVPIAPLPCGTANNLARSLGLTDVPLPELIAGWPAARRRPFDVGVARGSWGERTFLESFGAGLFAWTTANFDGEKKQKRSRSFDRQAEIQGARAFLRDRLREFSPRPIQVKLDDRDLSGDYLLLEAMNVRSMGPNIDLAPHADPGDGLLDLVLVGADELERLCSHLAEPGEIPARADFAIHRGRRLTIQARHAEFHLDDSAWPGQEKKTRPDSRAVEVWVKQHALIFLTPR